MTLYHYGLLEELPTGGAAPASPQLQTDWPNPVTRRASVSFLDTAVRSLALLTALTPAPFAQRDWPNPVRRVATAVDQIGYVDASEYWMLNGAKPFQQTEWPNPVRRVPPVADQFGSTDASEYWMLNGAKPFQQTEWPNTSRRLPAPDQIGFVDGTEYWLFSVVVQPPFKQTEWPNPVRRLPPSADQIGSTDASEYWMLNSVVPFAQYDWPLQPRNKYREVGWTDVLKVNLSFPFYQTDWPNPVRRRATSTQDHFNSSETQLLGQDTFFGPSGMGPSYDWPNPQRTRQRNEYGWSDQYKFTLFTPPASPFYQTDWPNPTRRVATAIDQVGYVDGTEYWMLNGAVPFAQYDWPLQLRNRYREVGWIDQYKFTLFAPPPSPFYQLDWQNPVLRRFNLQDFYRSAQTQLVGQDTFFAAPGMGPSYDWPNPQRSKYREVSWSSSLSLSFTIIEPFYQLDWPNPRGPRTKQSVNFTRSMDPRYVGQDTFFGPPGCGPVYDWTNPVLRRGTVPHGFIDPYKIVLNFVQPPFALLDWPNPRGPRSGVDLKTFLNTADLMSALLWVDKNARHIVGSPFFARFVGSPMSSDLDQPTVKIRSFTGSTLMAKHDPEDFVCGDTWQMSGPQVDGNGNPLALTGATFSWKLDDPDSAQNFITLGMSNIVVTDAVKSVILVTVPAALTAALAPGSYRDWLRVTLPGGQTFTQWTGIIRAGANPT